MILEEKSDKDNIIFNIPSINKKTWIRSDYQFNFNTPWMVDFNNFLNNQNTDKLSKEVKIESKDFLNDEKTDVVIPRFELNWVVIDFHKPWFDQIKRNITIKEFLYIYYHFIFWIELYTYIEIWTDKKTEKRIVNFELLNTFSKNKILDKIKDSLIEEKEVYIIPEKKYKMKWSKEQYEKTLQLWKDWEWKTVKIFHIDNEKKDTHIYLCPIRIWTDNKRDFDNLKKIISKLSPNQEYDKKEEEDKSKSILKTGEIFDYFVATSKIEAKSPENDTIRDKLSELWKEKSLSDEEIENWINFVNKFLANIL